MSQLLLKRLLGVVALLQPLLAAGQPAGDPVAGRAAFAPCVRCHAVGPAARHSFGPHLNQLQGRRAGSLGDYAYSEAMRKSGLVWDAATLHKYIKDPSGTVPGTKMRFMGFGYDERKIADLLAYLQRQQGPAP